jgi:hypothetical protein
MLLERCQPGNMLRSEPEAKWDPVIATLLKRLWRRPGQDHLPRYRADLDLIFANPDGTPLKPDSVSACVSLLSRRLKL